MQTVRTHHESTRQTATNARTLVAMLWRRRGIVALVLLLVCGTVGVGLVVAPRSYTAIARVAVSQTPQENQSQMDYPDLLGTVADVANSRPVLEKVSRAIGDRSVKQLQKNVKGNVVSGTVLVQISATDADPVKAAQIANAVMAILPEHDPSNNSVMFTTTEPAAVPTSFTSPNIRVTVLAGALLALAMAVAAAAIYDKMTRTVETPEEAVDATDLGVLGVVARPREATGIPAADSESSEFNSLRALRVALEFASSDSPTRSLVIAPAVRDPWSGWLEVNLAVSLAEVGHRVLLIDANRSDRRRHPVFEMGEARGLYDVLAGETTFEDVVVAGPENGVTVIPLGNLDLAAPSLLEMRYRTFLESVGEEYDVILIHADSVSDSDDARIMSIDGGLLLTIPSGKVKRTALEQAVADLRKVRIRVLGTVLLGNRRR